MSYNEQDIIKLFASMSQPKRDDIQCGIGDDAAILSVPVGHHLVSSCDTLNVGIHFPDDLSPLDIGYRCIAVNLSDLAACAAQPAWVQCALTLPQAHEEWIKHFIIGFQRGLQESGAVCVGGDVTRGPLAITMQVMGTVPAGKALLRTGAKVGDDIYVAGELGGAALGLQYLLGTLSADNNALAETAIQCWCEPRAQNTLGIALRDVATAGIDLSDGLSTDLAHLCRASGVAAQCYLEQLPLAACLQDLADKDRALALALSGGEDYILCFTAPADAAEQIQAIARATDHSLYCIGKITLADVSRDVITYLDASQHPVSIPAGYQHF